MHHCQTPWLLGILVPVRGLEIKSHLIAKPRARTPCLRKWTVMLTLCNLHDIPWQCCCFPRSTLIYLMLITLLGPVMESVNCQALLLFVPATVPSCAASFLPSVRPRLSWALVVSCGRQCPSLCCVVQTECGCTNDFGIFHWHNEYRFPKAECF